MLKFQELNCFCFTCLTSLLTHLHPNYTQKCILCLTENSAHLHHKDQPVNAAHVDNHCLSRAQHAKHKQTNRVGKTRSFYLILKRVVPKITKVRHRVNAGERLAGWLAGWLTQED